MKAGAQFLPNQIYEYPKKDQYIVIFLGINDTTPESLMKKIREMDTINDWTNKRTDEQLLNDCKHIIEESIHLEQECNKYGFYYFNTFKDRKATLKKIVKLVKKENKK